MSQTVPVILDHINVHVTLLLFRYSSYTVKFLKFRTPENFAVNYLKFKKRGQSVLVFRQKDSNGIANSEDPDQTAPLGAV